MLHWAAISSPVHRSSQTDEIAGDASGEANFCQDHLKINPSVLSVLSLERKLGWQWKVKQVKTNLGDVGIVRFH